LAIKPPRDIDSAARARFVRSFGYPFIFFGAVAFLYGVYSNSFIGMLIGFLVAFVLSLVTAIVTTLITNQAGEMAGGILFGAGRSTVSQRERLEGFLSQVRYHKMKGEIETAFEKVNALLDQEPDYAEALFLRAQILAEVPEGRRQAEKDCKRVLELVPSSAAPLHRWATRLLSDMYHGRY